MYYYKRNLGDYAKKAGRLTMLQHGAYTLLIDSCYDREQFPTLKQALEWTWASTKEEVEAITFVLNKFFTLAGEVYIQNRIQDELEDFHAKSCVNQKIAFEREAKRREKRTNRGRIVDEPLQEKSKESVEPEGFDVFWQAYPKKTAKPAALKAFKAAKINGHLPEVLKDIEGKASSEAWIKGGGQFIPNPSTYLNQRRWEDETGATKADNIGSFL